MKEDITIDGRHCAIILKAAYDIDDLGLVNVCSVPEKNPRKIVAGYAAARSHPIPG